MIWLPERASNVPVKAAGKPAAKLGLLAASALKVPVTLA